MNDGARTHDNRNHNPGLYQLSYAHHIDMRILKREDGTLGRTRTCDPRLRRPMLYPAELQAHVGRGGGIRTPDILLPKQARYQTALHPETDLPKLTCVKSLYQSLKELTMIFIIFKSVNYFFKKNSFYDSKIINFIKIQ